MKSFIKFLLIAMKEPMVILLLGAAIVTVGVGFYETIRGKSNAWLDGHGGRSGCEMILVAANFASRRRWYNMVRPCETPPQGNAGRSDRVQRDGRR